MAESTPAAFAATGRRKTAVARVNLKPGTGKWVVNARDPLKYFCTKAVLAYIEQPLVLTNTREKFDIVADISGGGPIGQAGA